MWNTKLQKEVHDDKIKLQKKNRKGKKTNLFLIRLPLWA